MRKGLGVGVLLLLSACVTPERPDVAERLAAAQQNHQAQLSGDLNGESAEVSAPASPPNRSGPPSWSLAFPPSCQTEEWCGVAVVEDCETPFSCRNAAELQAGRDLLCNISSRIRDRTIRRTQRTLTESGEETGTLTYSQELRERCADVPLREVRFEHAYWAAQQQHFTLARMPRPPVSETPPPVPATRTFRVAAETVGASQLQQLLQEEGLLAEEATETEPWSLSTTVHFELRPHDGTLFHGIAIAKLTVILQGPDASAAPERTWTIRRLLVQPPEALSASQRTDVETKTLNKGFSEFRSELLAFLRGS